MATTFNGITISGYTRVVRVGELVVPLQESKVFGLAGRTVIAGEHQGREVRIQHELTGFASASALQTYLDVTLKNGVLGQTGTLAVGGYETYADLVCRFIDPNPTEVGTLPDTSQNPTTFHRTITILFEQLS